jgi:integrase/recombinase XerD
VEGKITCNIMSNTVAASREERAAMGRDADPQPLSLYARDGARKYLNRGERRRALVAMGRLEPAEALFALTLAWTGGRVSEVLALAAASFQIELAIVTLRTLKRRKLAMREVPIPPELMDALNHHFRLAVRQQDPDQAGHRLWPCHRVTAWRLIKRVMSKTGVRGLRASPRGLRHGFGVGSLQSGVPLTLVKRWLGHTRISTTEIYLDVCGPEELALAERYWQSEFCQSQVPLAG